MEKVKSLNAEYFSTQSTFMCAQTELQLAVQSRQDEVTLPGPYRAYRAPCVHSNIALKVKQTLIIAIASNPYHFI